MDDQLIDHAARIECILPTLMRRLFTLDPDHSANELPLSQLRVCTILQSGPRSLSSVGEELGISASAATQIADRLERAEIVERVESPDDRRVRMLRLTRFGTCMMRTRREARIRQVSCALERLEPTVRTSVLQALSALLDATAPTALAGESDKPTGQDPAAR